MPGANRISPGGQPPPPLRRARLPLCPVRPLAATAWKTRPLRRPGARCCVAPSRRSSLPTMSPPCGRMVGRLIRAALPCRILQAMDGAEALDLARRECPLVVVLDVDMPKLNGYAVCRALKADPATASIVVLLLTGATEPDAEAVGRMAGADGFFRKPLGLLALQAKVQ